MSCIARNIFVDENNEMILNNLDHLVVDFNKLDDGNICQIEKEKQFTHMFHNLYSIAEKYTILCGEYFIDTFYMFPTDSSYIRALIKCLSLLYKDGYSDIYFYYGYLLRIGFLRSSVDNINMERMFILGKNYSETCYQKCCDELAIAKRKLEIEKLLNGVLLRSPRYYNKDETKRVMKLCDALREECWGYVFKGHPEFFDILIKINSHYKNANKVNYDTAVNFTNCSFPYLKSEIKEKIEFFTSNEYVSYNNSSIKKDIFKNAVSVAWKYLLISLLVFFPLKWITNSFIYGWLVIILCITVLGYKVYTRFRCYKYSWIK